MNKDFGSCPYAHCFSKFNLNKKRNKFSCYSQLKCVNAIHLVMVIFINNLDNDIWRSAHLKNFFLITIVNILNTETKWKDIWSVNTMLTICPFWFLFRMQTKHIWTNWISKFIYCSFYTYKILWLLVGNATYWIDKDGWFILSALFGLYGNA